MKLLKLVLRNFKGWNFTFEANGDNVDIFGANATGKTTIFDAFTWLLTDKDSQNKKDFAIKNLDETGKEAHNMEHEVTGVFEIDGQEVSLRKVYAEKWTKKRGGITAEFSGHETSYWIDGVPKPKKDYDTYIASIANETIFKLLTNPAFFNEQLHWQERRKILLEICGDISDADVIASDSKLAKLPDILGNRKLEDHRKVIAARRAEINKEIEKIPDRIDEATRALPDTANFPHPDAIRVEIASLRKQQQGKQQELARIEAGGEAAEKQKRLRELEGQMQELRNRHRAENDDKVFAKRQQKQELILKLGDLNRQIDEKQRRMQANAATIAGIEPKLQRLRDDWHAINSEQFSYVPIQACPTCGQALPEHQVAEAIEKAQQAFNLSKSTRLEAINASGKTIKDEGSRLEEENQNLSREIGRLNSEKDTLERSIATLQTEIDAMGAIQAIEVNPQYQSILREMMAIKEQIEAINSQRQTIIRQVQNEIHLLGQDIAARERRLLLLEQREQGLKRIAELEEQEKALGREFEKLEGELYLTEQFIQSKVRLLESRINSRFKLARFKLFDVQVNGGIAECCETTYRGVPYSSGLNNAARINVGLDIINTLSEHYGFTAPIFIDNAESVTDLIETRAQVIRLVVSADDPALRVECATQEINLFKEAV